MIAMRYGCVPVVRAVGGLHDSVTDGETGFAFIKPQPKDFVAAMQRALEAYQNTKDWRVMQINGMSKDFSWNQSAYQYFQLYEQLLSKRGKPQG